MMRPSNARTVLSLITGGLVVAAAVTAIGLAVADSKDGDDSASCGGGVWANGRSYLREEFNDSVFDVDDLGVVIGTVNRTGVCPSKNGDASVLPVGAELRAVPNVDPGVAFAVSVGSEVHFFRTSHPSGDLSAADVLVVGDVVEIGLNSDFDGSTRWAAITEPAKIEVVLDAVNSARQQLDGDDASTGIGLRTFLEFVRADGLATRAAYDVASHNLTVGDGEIWLHQGAADVVDAALAEAPAAVPTVELQLTGLNGSTLVRNRAECRIDRPDLALAPNERVKVDGAEEATSSIMFAVVSGPSLEPRSIGSSELAGGFQMPATAGPVIVELVDADGNGYCAVVNVIE